MSCWFGAKTNRVTLRLFGYRLGFRVYRAPYPLWNSVDS